jgi:hypothetical protein
VAQLQAPPQSASMPSTPLFTAPSITERPARRGISRREPSG